jgi:hypothetical protein
MLTHENHLGIDPEDLEEVLVRIEESYQIKFVANELIHIHTFGQLTDHILSKLTLRSVSDCTSQQAFYKLRTAIQSVRGHDTILEPNTNLASLFPRSTRRKDVKEVEKILEIRLHALQPRPVILRTLQVIFILSLFVIFVNGPMGWAGILFAIMGFWNLDRIATEWKDQTLRGLTNRMTQRHYIQSRRNAYTCNQTEIPHLVQKLFIETLHLHKRSIDRDTVIV